MCSMKWHERAPMSGGPDVVLSALTDVAETSFFAIVDPCDAARFRDLSVAYRQWMTATVRFNEPGCAGEVRCHLPSALALRLFDAFSGRDPGEPPPQDDEMHDLVGEFANMICGSWLTRAASDRTFSLSRPVVTDAVSPTAVADDAVVVAIDEYPSLVEIAFARRSDAAPAH